MGLSQPVWDDRSGWFCVAVGCVTGVPSRWPSTSRLLDRCPAVLQLGVKPLPGCVPPGAAGLDHLARRGHHNASGDRRGWAARHRGRGRAERLGERRRCRYKSRRGVATSQQAQSDLSAATDPQGAERSVTIPEFRGSYWMTAPLPNRERIEAVGPAGYCGRLFDQARAHPSPPQMFRGNGIRHARLASIALHPADSTDTRCGFHCGRLVGIRLQAESPSTAIAPMRHHPERLTVVPLRHPAWAARPPNDGLVSEAGHSHWKGQDSPVGIAPGSRQVVYIPLTGCSRNAQDPPRRSPHLGNSCRGAALVTDSHFHVISDIPTTSQLGR
jgi:hypothetical protein